MFRTIILAMLIGPWASFFAHAIGDSGGCGDFPRGPLGLALRSGSPQDVDTEILKIVNAQAPRISLSYRRDQAILDLIQGSYKKSPACAPGPLLPFAIEAGNLEVVRHLLGKPLGVSPQFPPDILFNCEGRRFHLPETQTSAASRRNTYAVLIQEYGADVHALYRRESLLTYCKDPELIELFIESGAHVDRELQFVTGPWTALQVAILDALQFEENSYTAKRLHALERIKLFIRHGSAPISQKDRDLIQKSCSREPQWKPKTCQELRALGLAGPPADLQEE